MTIDRRTLIGAGLATAGMLSAGTATALSPDPERFDLWPGRPPGGERVTVTQSEIARSPTGPVDDAAFANVTRPGLSVFRPAAPNGAAVLIIPGGGYRRVMVGHEGRTIARWFAERGVTAFVLLYRLPADGWTAGPDVSLQDAQRGIRLVRSRAATYGIDPARVAVLGFSAGGHLAGRLTTQFARPTYQAVDAADALSARPDIAGLIYPVVTMGEKTHRGSRDEMFGPHPSPEQIEAYSIERNVPADTPPTFLAHAADDGAVPIDNSLMLFAALREKKVPAELHVYEVGGHGFGLRNPRTGGVISWPQLFLDWGGGHGWVP